MEIEAGGVEIEAGGLEIEAGGLEIVAGGLEIEAGGLEIEAGGLEIGAGGFGKYKLSRRGQRNRSPSHRKNEHPFIQSILYRRSLYRLLCVWSGWCSAQPRLSLEKYGIPCKDLAMGDICLPPNHPEAIRTPDLCDRFKRFEFSR